MSPRTGVLPPPFAGLSYDAYRGIRPMPGRAAMLPQGRISRSTCCRRACSFPIRCASTCPHGDGFSRRVLRPATCSISTTRYFDAIPDTAPGAGFSGLRLRHPLNTPDVLDEVLVVQGASYFRAIGQAMVYGLSARAVAHRHRRPRGRGVPPLHPPAPASGQ